MIDLITFFHNGHFISYTTVFYYLYCQYCFISYLFLSFSLPPFLSFFFLSFWCYRLNPGSLKLISWLHSRDLWLLPDSLVNILDINKVHLKVCSRGRLEKCVCVSYRLRQDIFVEISWENAWCVMSYILCCPVNVCCWTSWGVASYSAWCQSEHLFRLLQSHHCL